jgi:xylulokinase
MKTVLGIDLGTQSLKVVFYDYRAKQIVASAAASLQVLRGDDGRAEQEADWWLAALEAALGDIPGDVRASVQAIGVSGQQHGFVAVNAAGRVLAPVKLWCDTATQQEADEITEACGGREKCIEHSGNPVLTGYTAPKIRWLAKNNPDAYRQMTHILLPHDYMNHVLTGKMTMEFGDASGTGLLDVRERTWSGEMLRAVDAERDLSACLPPLLQPDEIIGTTTEAFSRRFGLPAGVPVAPGGGDNMMAAIGTGNVTAGKLTMSLGTSGTLFAYSDTPVIDPAGNIAAFCSSTGGWLPLLCTMNCTYATELMKKPLDVTNEQFDDTISAIAAGSDELTVLPFFSGERTPNLPRATASFLGLNERNCTRGHMLRATVEGATFGVRVGLDALSGLGLAASEIVLTGGGSKSRTWCQIVADVCDLPVTLLAQDEGASFGAALHALWILERRRDAAIGIEDISVEHLSRQPDLCRVPDPANAERYQISYAAYLRAVTQLAPLFEKPSGVTQ